MGFRLNKFLDSRLNSRLYAVGRSGALQIGEVARRTALSVDSIRFYERQRLLPAPERSEGRFRLYTSADIERLQFIREIQGLGFTLREIKELLDLRTHGVEA